MDVIFFASSALGLLNTRNKYISYICLALLLILFCFSSGCADRENYALTIELSKEKLSAEYNLGYFYLTYLFSLYHLDVQYFCFLIGLVYVLSIFYIIKSFSRNPNFVISYYMIAIFLFDVIQLKYTMSMIFVTWGFYFLFKIGNNKKKIIVYSMFVLLASLFHVSAIFFILFNLVVLDKKDVFRISIALLVVLIGTKQVLIGNLVNSLGAADKYSLESNYGAGNILATQILLAVLIIMYFVCYKCYSDRSQDNLLDDYGVKISYLLILLFPLISISVDCRRVYFYASIILFVIISNWISKKSRLVISVYMLIFSVFYLNRFILLGNYDTVYKPIFNNNVLIQNLFGG